jgi:hypothetical protein
MRDIEKKAMALLNASEKKMGLYKTKKPPYELPSYVALYLSIEQHEAFKQEVSDVVYRSLMSIAKNCVADAAGDLSRFIIPKPKPDPLVDVLDYVEWPDKYALGKDIRTALDALGFEIREKGQ